MKTGAQHNTLYIILIVIIQTIITSFIYTGPYLTVTLLPFVILMMPVNWTTAKTLIAATLSALPVDLFAEGVIGLNTAAILPAVLAREGVIRAFTANDQRDREGMISAEWLGWLRFTVLASAVLIVFLVLYIIFECAGTRPTSFILLKTALSYAANLAIYALLQQAVLKPPKNR